MRLFLRATRAIISAATTLHILTLKGAVALNNRRDNRATRATDAASVAVHSANAQYQACINREVAQIKASAIFYDAALSEARSLRRGATL